MYPKIGLDLGFSMGSGAPTERETWIASMGGRNAIIQHVIEGIHNALRVYGGTAIDADRPIDRLTPLAALDLTNQVGAIDFRRALVLREVYRQVWQPTDGTYSEDPYAPRNLSDGELRFFGRHLTIVDKLVDMYADSHVVDLSERGEAKWSEQKQDFPVPPQGENPNPPGSREAFVWELGGREAIVEDVAGILRGAYAEFGDRRVDWATAPLPEGFRLIAPGKAMTFRVAFTYAWFLDHFFEGTQYARLDGGFIGRSEILRALTQPLWTIRDLVDFVIDRAIMHSRWRRKMNIWEARGLPESLRFRAELRRGAVQGGDDSDPLNAFPYDEHGHPRIKAIDLGTGLSDE